MVRTEFRHAVRSLVRQPRFAAVAVGTLALGIGAATAVFSVVHALLLTPLPFAYPDRLVLVSQRLADAPDERRRVAAPDAADLRTAPEFHDVAWVRRVADGTLGDDGASRHVRIGAASGNLFDVLGVQAALGRTFRAGEGTVPVPEDSLLGALTVPIVLTHAYWLRRYGGTAEVVGMRVTLNGGSGRVIGVLPPDFALSLPADLGLDADADLWRPVPVPLSVFRRVERLQDRDSDNTGAVIARLTPDADETGVGTHLAGIAATRRAEYPRYADAGVSFTAEPLAHAAVADVRPVLAVLSVAVALVLLIACLNVAGLLLARAVEREDDLAVRVALGAGPRRIIFARMLEAGVVAGAGGTAGLLGAAWLADWLMAAAPGGATRAANFGLHPSVAVFSLLATLAAALTAGSLPTLQGARAGRALRLRNRGGTAPARGRRPLVAGQIGVAFALLIATGLLVQSVHRLRAVHPGFDTRGVLTFGIAFRGDDYPGPAERAQVVAQLHAALTAAPEIDVAGTVAGLPLSGMRWTQPWGLDGEAPGQWGARRAAVRPVTSDYFRAVGTRLLGGRTFTPGEDVTEERRIVVVDQRLAERVAPGGNAVGRFIVIPLDGDPVRAEIVGIVEDVRQHDLRTAGPPTIYVPYRQEASRQITVVVRSTRDPRAVGHLVERAVELVDPRLPVFDIQPLRAYIASAVARERFTLSLIAAFGTIGLLLALVGLYGTVAYGVRIRLREFGIRRALGADDAHIGHIVMRDGLTLAGVGIAVGVAVALPAVRSVKGLLFGIGPFDPATWAGIAAAVVMATAVASWVPARTARRAEPMAVLRQE